MFKQFILVHFSYKNIQRVFPRNMYKIFNYFLVVKKKKFSMKNRSTRNVIVLLSSNYTVILLHCKFFYIFHFIIFLNVTFIYTFLRLFLSFFSRYFFLFLFLRFPFQFHF